MFHVPRGIRACSETAVLYFGWHCGMGSRLHAWCHGECTHAAFGLLRVALALELTRTMREVLDQSLTAYTLLMQLSSARENQRLFFGKSVLVEVWDFILGSGRGGIQAPFCSQAEARFAKIFRQQF